MALMTSIFLAPASLMMTSNYSNYLAYRVALENGDTTAVNEVKSFLAEIESQKHLNAFLETWFMA